MIEEIDITKISLWIYEVTKIQDNNLQPKYTNDVVKIIKGKGGHPHFVTTEKLNYKNVYDLIQVGQYYLICSYQVKPNCNIWILSRQLNYAQYMKMKYSGLVKIGYEQTIEDLNLYFGDKWYENL